MLSSLSILSVSLLFVNDVVIDEDLVKRLRLQDIQCQKIIRSVGLEEDGIPPVHMNLPHMGISRGGFTKSGLF